MGNTYIDKIDESATIKEMKRHLEKFRFFCRSDINDYINVGGSVIKAASGSKSDKSILDAIEKNDERREYIEKILNGINKLDPDAKDIILLKYFYGKTNEAISKETLIHIVSVRKRISKACLDLAIILGLEVIRR